MAANVIDVDGPIRLAGTKMMTKNNVSVLNVVSENFFLFSSLRPSVVTIFDLILALISLKIVRKHLNMPKNHLKLANLAPKSAKMDQNNAIFALIFDDQFSLILMLF